MWVDLAAVCFLFLTFLDRQKRDEKNYWENERSTDWSNLCEHSQRWFPFRHQCVNKYSSSSSHSRNSQGYVRTTVIVLLGSGAWEKVKGHIAMGLVKIRFSLHQGYYYNGSQKMWGPKLAVLCRRLDDIYALLYARLVFFLGSCSLWRAWQKIGCDI